MIAFGQLCREESYLIQNNSIAGYRVNKELQLAQRQLLLTAFQSMEMKHRQS